MRQTTTHRWQRRLFLVVAALSLLVAGCSGAYWTWRHPEGLDYAALQQAKSECQTMAKQQLNRFDYYRPYDDARYYRDRDYRSGRFRPYYPLRYYDFHRYNFDLNQLYRFCMQAKGWQRIMIEPSEPQNPE